MEQSPEETCKHIELAQLEVDAGVQVSKEALHKWLQKFNSTAIRDPLVMAYLYTSFGHTEDAKEKMYEWEESERKLKEELQDLRDAEVARLEETCLQELVDHNMGKVSAEVAIMALGDEKEEES
jgi:hypothetical protein